MLFVTKLPSAGLILLLTITMTMLTGCSGGDDTTTDSGSSTGDVAGETTGSDGEETTTSDETTGSEGEDTGGDDEQTGGEDEETGGDDEQTGGEDQQSPDPIGNPVGDSIQIDHNAVKSAVDANLAMHIDGLESALVFLEASNALTNLVETFSDDEEDDDGEEGNGNHSEDDEPAVDIDLSELRDDILEVLSDRILVESTATLSTDGTELSYAFTPEFFCAPDEADEPLSEEEMTERAEDEADCSERITNTPLRLTATSDSDNDVNLRFLVGADDVEVFQLQIHDDMIAVVASLSGVKALLEVFIDSEDFEFPETMEGSVGVEVREVGSLQYDLRFAMNEAISLIPAEGQDTIELSLEQNLEPGGLSLDGPAGTITGEVEVSEILVGLPWQMVVDIFWDDEGSHESICETNEETNETNCWDEYVDGEEAPDVDGIMHIQLPGASGSVDVSSAGDVFSFTSLSLGEGSLVVDVSGETILMLDLNPNHDRTLNMSMVGETPRSTRMEMSPALDATVTFSMESVQDAFQDLPEFMLNEALGVRMEGEADQSPSMSMTRDEEDSGHMQVSSGQLTLWSDSMEDDVVITAGQCIESGDDDTLTEEEEDAQHDLFGGLYGASCSE